MGHRQEDKYLETDPWTTVHGRVHCRVTVQAISLKTKSGFFIDYEIVNGISTVVVFPG